MCYNYSSNLHDVEYMINDQMDKIHENLGYKIYRDANQIRFRDYIRAIRARGTNRSIYVNLDPPMLGFALVPSTHSLEEADFALDLAQEPPHQIVEMHTKIMRIRTKMMRKRIPALKMVFRVWLTISLIIMLVRRNLTPQWMTMMIIIMV